VEAELCYKLNGLFFKVHNDLGRFARERQYADLFEPLLIKAGLVYEREYEIKNVKPDSPKGNRVDFLVGDRVIVDFKAKTIITKDDYVQMQRYLNAANLELGLIVNFRAQYLKPKRILNSNYSGNSDEDSDHSDRGPLNN
jgi:GxxExxY protein